MNRFLFTLLLFFVLFLITISGAISYVNSLQEKERGDYKTKECGKPQNVLKTQTGIPLDIFFLCSGFVLSVSLSYLFSFQITYGDVLFTKRKKMILFFCVCLPLFCFLTLFFSFLMKGISVCHSHTNQVECHSIVPNTLQLPSFQCDTTFHMNYYYGIMLFLMLSSLVLNIVLKWKRRREHVKR